jgi:uncharacterized protein (TIGR03790 family)
MTNSTSSRLLVILFCCSPLWALQPDEILVLANSNHAASVRLARYYCERRGVPSGHVVPLALGTTLRDTVSRDDYEKRIAQPIRRLLSTRPDMAGIKCLVTTYGIPFRVGARGPLSQHEARLIQIRTRLEQAKEAVSQLEAADRKSSAEYRQHARQVTALQAEINWIEGKETHASVDSELSMALFGTYELYRWQPNLVRSNAPQPSRTLMVCRLDGPDYGIAAGLVDKALEAEANGLTGTAYVDSRGMFSKDAYGHYDQSLRDLALLIQLRTSLPVKEERTSALFEPGSCPDTALYCGWYSVSKYVDAFAFVPGAVGFHIASFEAASLRDPNSTQWCPAMLTRGITATLGPVAEPYLHSFPEPKAFFSELFAGSCLVETFYHTKPFNSWQLVLIGDPLYRPFRGDAVAAGIGTDRND